MSQDFQSGDFLLFQLESGYGLLRILAIDNDEGERIWHLAAYGDFFLDAETADTALRTPKKLTLIHPHVALTNRAFESTQVAQMKNVSLEEGELKPLEDWKKSPRHEVSDRSVRLMLGLR